VPLQLRLSCLDRSRTTLRFARPVREVWAEIWDIIHPRIEQVMAGGPATWHESPLVPITRHGPARGCLLDAQLRSDCGALTIRSVPGQGTTIELWLRGGVRTSPIARKAVEI
jgi:hypothetical protein